MYTIKALGYENFPKYKTLAEAREMIKSFVKEDIETAPYKLAKIRHTRDSVELKIGTRNGIHTYSYYTISKLG